jgi:hypothetical protein
MYFNPRVAWEYITAYAGPAFWLIGGGGAAIYTAVAKPKLRIVSRGWTATAAPPGAAENGTWYECDCLLYNDGRKDVRGATLTVCLPPGWRVVSPFRETTCEPQAGDSSLPYWARFRITIDAPLTRSAPRELLCLKVAFADKARIAPPQAMWRLEFPGGMNPKVGYTRLLNYRTLGRLAGKGASIPRRRPLAR